MRGPKDHTAWLRAIERAGVIQDQLYYSRRRRFVFELRPILENGDRVAYPDAIWNITDADVDRAAKFVGVLTSGVCGTCGAIGYGNATCRACVSEWPRFDVPQDVVDQLLETIGDREPEAPVGAAEVAKLKEWIEQPVDWQPIASVPRGIDVLVTWQWEDGTWATHVDSLGDDGEWMITEGEAQFWMPVPAPPKAGNGA